MKITAWNDDVHDVRALTPGTLLTRRPLVALPDEDVTERRPTGIRERMKLVQHFTLAAF